MLKEFRWRHHVKRYSVSHPRGGSRSAKVFNGHLSLADVAQNLRGADLYD